MACHISPIVKRLGLYSVRKPLFVVLKHTSSIVTIVAVYIDNALARSDFFHY